MKRASLFVFAAVAAWLAIGFRAGRNQIHPGNSGSPATLGDERLPAHVRWAQSVIAQASLKENADGDRRRSLQARRGASPATVAQIAFCKLGLDHAAGELHLTPHEIDVLATDLADFMLLAGELKLEAGKVTTRTDSGLEIAVPSRPRLAEDLSERFIQQLAADLAPERALQIDAALGSFLNHRFAGFGAADETFVIEQNPFDRSTYSVMHTDLLPSAVRSNHGEFLGTDFVGGSNGMGAASLKDFSSMPQYAFLLKLIGHQ